MKSYTDIEQSKKLAKILPLESADMSYKHIDQSQIGVDFYTVPILSYKYASYKGIPCWSLAALFNYLREIDFFPEIYTDEFMVTMNINYYDKEEENLLAPIHNIKVKAESFIDACVEMIIKLHELKML